MNSLTACVSTVGNSVTWLGATESKEMAVNSQNSKESSHFAASLSHVDTVWRVHQRITTYIYYSTKSVKAQKDI